MLTKLLVACVATLAISTAAASAADPPPIFVGGRFIREHAIEDSRGHLLVPVRGVFEAFHASVVYTAPRIVVVRKDGAVVAGLVIGRHHAVVGNRARYLAVAPMRFHGRIYVPLRDISEIAGASVIYSRHPRLVDIHLPFRNSVRTVPSLAADIPPESVTPPWAYALVSVAVAGFLVELLRRVGGRIFGRRSARSNGVALAVSPFALSNAIAPGDQHDIR